MSDAEARLTTLEIVRRWPTKKVVSFHAQELRELPDLPVFPSSSYSSYSSYTWRDFWFEIRFGNYTWRDFWFDCWFLNPRKLLAWLCGVLCPVCRRYDRNRNCDCTRPIQMTITSVPVMAVPRSNLRTYDQASINAQLDEMELAIEHANRDIQRAIQKMDRAFEKLPRL